MKKYLFFLTIFTLLAQEVHAQVLEEKATLPGTALRVYCFFGNLFNESTEKCRSTGTYVEYIQEEVEELREQVQNVVPGQPAPVVRQTTIYRTPTEATIREIVADYIQDLLPALRGPQGERGEQGPAGQNGSSFTGIPQVFWNGGGGGTTNTVNTTVVVPATTTNSLSLAGTILTSIVNGVASSTDLTSLTGSSTSDWALTGNAGTDSNVNFLGTTDNQDLVFKTNNATTGIIRANGISFAFGLNASVGGSTDRTFFAGQSAGQNAANAVSSNFLGFFAGNNAINADGSNFFGSSAGQEATDANSSNFFGTFAGLQATGAEESNFLGYAAGQQAISANRSNFLGYAAGFQASSASNSNFFGFQAGTFAASASNSNFFGSNAGYQANSQYSNFFGESSGYQASGANQSNFFGEDSGYGALNASNSNFFGQYAGTFAGSASSSNFFGPSAGSFAGNAHHSNFFGDSAGLSASAAYHSNFIGYQAGRQASGARRSIFIGDNAGLNDSVNNGLSTSASSSILIGNNTNTGGFSDSIAIGAYTQNSAAQQLNIGNTIYATNIQIGPVASSAPIANSFVGIGTSTPNQKLTVIGNIFASSTGTSTFTGNLNVRSQLQVGTSSTYIRSNATSTFDGGINLTNGGCFAINGVCISGGGSGSSTTILSGNGISVATTSTSSTISLGGSLTQNTIINQDGNDFEFVRTNSSGFATITTKLISTNNLSDFIFGNNHPLSGSPFTQFTGISATTTSFFGSPTWAPVALMGIGTNDSFSEMPLIGAIVSDPNSNGTSTSFTLSRDSFNLDSFGSFGTLGNARGGRFYVSAGGVSMISQYPDPYRQTQIQVGFGGDIGIRFSSHLGGYNFPLASGATGTVLSIASGTQLAFQTPASLGIAATGTLGAIQFHNGAGQFGSTSTLLYATSTGNFGIGTSTPVQKLHVRLTGTGPVGRFEDNNGFCDIDPTLASLVCASDGLLKKDIISLGAEGILATTSSILDRALQLNPVSYRWSDESQTVIPHYGFVAQEVESIFPELVITDTTTGLKKVSYGAFGPIAIQSIKDMNDALGNITKRDLTADEFRGSRIGKLIGAAFSLQGNATGTIEKLDPIASTSEITITKWDGLATTTASSTIKQNTKDRVIALLNSELDSELEKFKGPKGDKGDKGDSGTSSISPISAPMTFPTLPFYGGGGGGSTIINNVTNGVQLPTGGLFGQVLTLDGTLSPVWATTTSELPTGGLFGQILSLNASGTPVWINQATTSTTSLTFFADGKFGFGTTTFGTSNIGAQPFVAWENASTSLPFGMIDGGMSEVGLYVTSNPTDLGGMLALDLQRESTNIDEFIFFYDRNASSSRRGVGNIRANGLGGVAYNTTSDKRLKNNIVETHYTVEDVMSIKAYDYTFRGTDVVQTGFLAQDLYKVFPDAVAVGGDDENINPWMVDYSKLSPLLLKSIQDIYLGITDEDALLEDDGKKTFTGKFFDRLSVWLGDITNGITKVFAKEVETERLCITEAEESFCITKDDLKALKGLIGQTSPSNPQNTSSQGQTSNDILTPGEPASDDTSGEVPSPSDTTSSTEEQTSLDTVTESETPSDSTSSVPEEVPVVEPASQVEPILVP